VSDRVLIPFNGALLSLTVEQLAEAQAAAAALAPATATQGSQAVEPLVDAETAAAQLGVTARLLEDYTRSGIAPHYRIGRFVRYRVSELAAHFRVAGAAPPTDSQSVTPFRRQAKQ
jgi:hypothetical protein